MNDDVTAYINNRPETWQVEACRRLRGIVHSAVDGVEERIQYGKPHFLAGGSYAAVITAAKSHVSLTIFNAQGLDAPDGLFEPGKPERRTVKITADRSVDYDLLQRLLKEAAGAAS